MRCIAMKRTICSLMLGVILTGLFVSGLAWMTTLRERRWSDDPRNRRRQVIFVMATVSVVLVGYEINRILNRPRYTGRYVGSKDDPPSLGDRELDERV